MRGPLGVATGRVNTDMVDLEPLDGEDVDLLHHLVGRHVEETGSAVGRALLDEWAAAPDKVAGRFTNVMPRDYKNVLDDRARALDEGLDADSPETLQRIMEAAHG